MICSRPCTQKKVLAAVTQVDIHQRIIVIDVSENRDERLVLINPELLKKAAKQALKKVACRSLNNVL